MLKYVIQSIIYNYFLDTFINFVLELQLLQKSNLFFYKIIIEIVYGRFILAEKKRK